jgi:hypothetical protein
LAARHSRRAAALAALMRFQSRERGAVVRQNDGQSERSKRRASACGRICAREIGTPLRRRQPCAERCDRSLSQRWMQFVRDDRSLPRAFGPLRSRLRIRFVAAPMRFQSRERGAVVRQNDGQSERSKRRASACGQISVAKFARRCGDGGRVRNAVTARFRSAGCSSPVMTARSRGPSARSARGSESDLSRLRCAFRAANGAPSFARTTARVSGQSAEHQPAGGYALGNALEGCGDGSRVRNAVTARFRSAGCSSPVMTARSRGPSARSARGSESDLSRL